MPSFIPKSPLAGQHTKLENLSEAHFDGLKAIVTAAGKEIFVHTHLGSTFEEYFEKALKTRCEKSHAPFVLRDQKTNDYIGMTRLFSEALKHKTCEIGYTWYHPSFWGQPVNPEAKFLLLQHAFEHCGMLRVQFRTDTRNLHSRAAIQKLGAKPEGVLRRHRILPDGSRRDSAIFSIIEDEWPQVKQALSTRLKN